MIQITSWNDGFETHDSRKTRGKLSWVRQNILMGEVAWAKLWLRSDAPEIWAGWTALVWASAQAETRGTTTNAEDVSLVSRVPQAMVEKAIEWALSNGFAQLSGDLPGKLPQPSRNLPDDLPIDSRQVPDVAGNHPDYSTVQDSTRQDSTNEQGARSVERFHPPTESEWVSYCKETWPDWHPECSANSWAYYQGVGWMAGKTKIKSWQHAAKTSYGKAKTNGYLQPKGVTTRPSRMVTETKDPVLAAYYREEEARIKSQPTLSELMESL